MLPTSLRNVSKAAGQLSRRHLSVHEHTAKGFMLANGIDCQRGITVSNLNEVATAAEKIQNEYKSKMFVVKSAVLAGGRGKGHFDSGLQGGVKLAKSIPDVVEIAKNMLGHRLITKQTSAQGQPVSKVFIAECLDIKKEYYFAVMLNAKHQGPVIIASEQGGMDIETVAKDSPDAIITVPIDMKAGFSKAAAEELAAKIGFKGDNVGRAADLMTRLVSFALKSDATMVEINPLVETDDGRVACVDAKFQFDDSAAYRHPEIFSERDETQEDPTELKMKKLGLNYIALDGNIACMVNGAGLAMATMDIIHAYGGRPANFLDVGGGATSAGVQAAIESINKDPSVKGVLVNIFGGIMRCDEVARGLVAALQNIPDPKPMVVRMTGTNQQHAWEIMKASQARYTYAEDLDDAAGKVIKMCS